MATEVNKWCCKNVRLSVNSMWINIAEQMQQKQGNPAKLARWAEVTLPELHQQLLLDTEYQENLSQAQTCSVMRYSESIPLFENSQIKASLVTIQTGKSLPLHDHPGASGTMMVIDGEVSIHHCNAEQSQNGSPLTLEVIETTNLLRGQVSWFTDSEKNIHSIGTETHRAVLLIIHTPGFSAHQQSFYFPLTGKLVAGSRVKVQKIRARVFNTKNNKPPTLLLAGNG